MNESKCKKGVILSRDELVINDMSHAEAMWWINNARDQRNENVIIPLNERGADLNIDSPSSDVRQAIYDLAPIPPTPVEAPTLQKVTESGAETSLPIIIGEAQSDNQAATLGQVHKSITDAFHDYSVEKKNPTWIVPEGIIVPDGYTLFATFIMQTTSTRLDLDLLRMYHNLPNDSKIQTSDGYSGDMIGVHEWDLSTAKLSNYGYKTVWVAVFTSAPQLNLENIGFNNDIPIIWADIHAGDIGMIEVYQGIIEGITLNNATVRDINLHENSSLRYFETKQENAIFIDSYFSTIRANKIDLVLPFADGVTIQNISIKSINVESANHISMTGCNIDVLDLMGTTCNAINLYHINNTKKILLKAGSRLNTFADLSKTALDIYSSAIFLGQLGNNPGGASVQILLPYGVANALYEVRPDLMFELNQKNYTIS